VKGDHSSAERSSRPFWAGCGGNPPECRPGDGHEFDNVFRQFVCRADLPQPHKGKVLAVVQHSDDIPYFAPDWWRNSSRRDIPATSSDNQRGRAARLVGQGCMGTRSITATSPAARLERAIDELP
jgi:hypothetical protein